MIPAWMRTLAPATRQREVHDYIKRYFRRFGESPTRQQLASAMGFRSPNAAQYYVEVLAKKGALLHIEGKNRGIVPQSAPQPDSDVRFALHYWTPTPGVAGTL
jgi:SOS-response transcriptional repressor LexA